MASADSDWHAATASGRDRERLLLLRAPAQNRVAALVRVDRARTSSDEAHRSVVDGAHRTGDRIDCQHDWQVRSLPSPSRNRSGRRLPHSSGAVEVKVIVCGITPPAGATANNCCTCGAGAYVALPPWFASIVQVPAPMNVTVPLLIAHTGRRACVDRQHHRQIRGRVAVAR